MKTKERHAPGRFFLCDSEAIVVDLVPVDRIRLHILRASNGEKHPDAVTPIITHPVDRHSFFDISICGSQVCLCLGSPYPYDTLVWEWTTGKLIFVSVEVGITPTRSS